MVVVIRRIKAASTGLPSGGHNQSEADKFDEISRDQRRKEFMIKASFEHTT